MRLLLLLLSPRVALKTMSKEIVSLILECLKKSDDDLENIKELYKKEFQKRNNNQYQILKYVKKTIQKGDVESNLYLNKVIKYGRFDAKIVKPEEHYSFELDGIYYFIKDEVYKKAVICLINDIEALDLKCSIFIIHDYKDYYMCMIKVSWDHWATE